MEELGGGVGWRSWVEELGGGVGLTRWMGGVLEFKNTFLSKETALQKICNDKLICYLCVKTLNKSLYNNIFYGNFMHVYS